MQPELAALDSNPQQQLARVVGLLESLQPSDWRAFLSGWVTAGSYGEAGRGAFSAADIDWFEGR